MPKDATDFFLDAKQAIKLSQEKGKTGRVA